MLRFLVVISFFVCLNSCKEPSHTELIVGDWRQLNGDEKISFYKDGTCANYSPQGSWNGAYKFIHDETRIVVSPLEIKDQKTDETTSNQTTTTTSTTSTTVIPTYKITTDPTTSVIVELTSDKLIIKSPPENGGNSAPTTFVRDKEK